MLDWLQPNPKAELLIVMIACPCLMNMLQYWIQDTFLKKKSAGHGTTKEKEERQSILQNDGLGRIEGEDLKRRVGSDSDELLL